MQFTFETTNNQKSLSVMAKCIRKTVRKKKSKRSHIFGWIVFVLALLLSFSSGDEGFVIDARKIITWIAALAIFIALIFEDKINGYVASKRMLKGTEEAVSIFDTENKESFSSETAVGKTDFYYERIGVISETDRYFVFVYSINRAQVYDKNNLSGGTADEFRKFISEVTNKEIITVK